jgi:hypothetical protein
MLTLGLNGFGKYGKSFFDQLVLPLPEAAQKAVRKAARRTKEQSQA